MAEKETEKTESCEENPVPEVLQRIREEGKEDPKGSVAVKAMWHAEF